MQPTLEQKDRLVVERITPLFSGHKHGDEWWIRIIPDFMRPELQRGDLVVVRSPEDPGLELVKRLIGLPGDTLRFEEGKLFLKPAGGSEFTQVNEDYIQVDDPDLMNADGTRRSYRVNDLGGYLHEGEELRVPEKRLFLMGDNRTRSNDSRRWLQIEVRTSETPGVDRLWVHTTSVEGVVLFRLWPFNRIWPPVK
jgi:signal peptidase I